ncbi:ATPase [Shewanella corallii]|uniref:ATPase n=1 Tax=Shewanella corallii TaxID=560080 RepID=A0ABT0N5B1_9GAMM|nr:BadF/BadG/BcrA/BcrD ATPase family protein [Shewanella corallii]MCL2913340.1 ATPase [Shewanella corallii]
MGASQTACKPTYIGIDGGGSKCRASIYTEDLVLLGTGVAGRANPLHGLEQAFQSIEESVQLALADANLKPEDAAELIAGAGLAGVNVPSLFEKMAAWQHPFKAMYLTSDLHTACIGAHEGEDGAVIITGTGSCGYAHVGDETLCLGGHGFALGDKGSGAWLGLKAAEHVLLSLDGFAPETQLTPVLMAQFEASDTTAIVEKLAGKSSSVYATLARSVLECAAAGDKVALNIVTEGAEYISQMARALLAVNPPRFSMIGGLAEPLQPWLDKDIAEALAPTLAPPEVGAALFAKHSHDDRH